MGGKDRMLLPLDDLRTTGTQLDAIISELESASARQNDVEEAVGRPAGDSRLKDRCHDFEGSWNNSRDKLLDKLRQVSERIAGTVSETETADLELAKQNSSGTGSGARGRAVTAN